MNNNNEDEKLNKEEENNLNIESDEKLEKFQKILLIIYISIIITLTICLTFIKPFKLWIINFFKDFHNKSLSSHIFLIIFGILLVIIGFPFFLYEITVCFAIKKFFLAYFMIFLMKIIGNILVFAICKLFLKKIFEKIFRNSRIFTIFKYGINKNPWKMPIIIKLMTIPILIKSYGLGISDINVFQFLLATVISSLIFTFIWTYIGTQINNIDDIISFKQIGIFKISLLICTFIIIFAISFYSKKAYEEMEKEMNENQKICSDKKIEDYGSLEETLK